jgi:hypothetical protein
MHSGVKTRMYTYISVCSLLDQLFLVLNGISLIFFMLLDFTQEIGITEFPLLLPGFSPWSNNLGFVVDKVAWG